MRFLPSRQHLNVLFGFKGSLKSSAHVQPNKKKREKQMSSKPEIVSEKNFCSSGIKWQRDYTVFCCCSRISQQGIHLPGHLWLSAPYQPLANNFLYPSVSSFGI